MRSSWRGLKKPRSNVTTPARQVLFITLSLLMRVGGLLVLGYKAGAYLAASFRMLVHLPGLSLTLRPRKKTRHRGDLGKLEEPAQEATTPAGGRMHPGKGAPAPPGGGMCPDEADTAACPGGVSCGHSLGQRKELCRQEGKIGHRSHMAMKVCARLLRVEMGKRRNDLSNRRMASGIAHRGSKIDARVSCQGAKRQKPNLGYSANWNKSKAIGLLSITHHEGNHNVSWL